MEPHTGYPPVTASWKDVMLVLHQCGMKADFTPSAMVFYKVDDECGSGKKIRTFDTGVMEPMVGTAPTSLDTNRPASRYYFYTTPTSPVP